MDRACRTHNMVLLNGKKMNLTERFVFDRWADLIESNDISGVLEQVPVTVIQLILSTSRKQHDENAHRVLARSLYLQRADYSLARRSRRDVRLVFASRVV
jgi:hypothetical protein